MKKLDILFVHPNAAEKIYQEPKISPQKKEVDPKKTNVN